MKLQQISRDPSRSIEGIWWNYETQAQVSEPVDGVVCLRVAEKDNPRYRDLLADARQTNAQALPAEPSDEVLIEAMQQAHVEAMASGILTDWSGIEGDDGEPLPYSPETSLRVLRDADLWHLRQFVEDASSTSLHYRRKATEVAAGNC